MTARAPSIPIHLESKGYTRVSDGIDLITSTERKALQAKVEDLTERRDRKDPTINRESTVTILGRWRKRMQAMKIEEELAVLEFDKKDNVNAERMIDFYKQEQALVQLQLLKGDEFESDTSLQLKQLVLLDYNVKIKDLVAREAKFKEEKKASEKGKSKSKRVKAKKQKVDSGKPVVKTTWTAKDKTLLGRLRQRRGGTYQKYLIELRVIKVELCRKGLKLETPEARQLFKSFEEATNTLTQVQRISKIYCAKARESFVNLNDSLRDVLNGVKENANARTIVPSKVDPAELVSISNGCRWAVEQMQDIDENDVDFLEKIERIAERAVSMF